MTFEEWWGAIGWRPDLTTQDFAKAAWDTQQRKIDDLEQKYDQAKIWAGDCICRCPIQEL